MYRKLGKVYIDIKINKFTTFKYISFIIIFNIMSKTIAYIDGANLDKGVKSENWKLDYKKLRIWLKDKHKVDKAYMFLGMRPEFKNLYTKLQNDGYVLVFKEVILYGDNNIKGNCDTELTVQSMRDHFEQNHPQVVLISGDGDFSCLVDFFIEKNKFKTLIAPNKRLSSLLKKKNIRITFIKDIENKLKKTPNKDETM